MRATIKRYYEKTEEVECKARIVGVYESAIELDQTIAYPEGGGQEGDHGRIRLREDSNIAIEFNDTQICDAIPVLIDEFPGIRTGGIILHQVENRAELRNFHVGDEVVLEIDRERRKKMSLHHSAAHVLYWAIDLCRPGAVRNTIGCHIKTNGARLDFLVEERFTQEEINKIEELANELIRVGCSITMSSREDYPDARYWECNGYVIPCGGTHVKNTNDLPLLKVQRKNIGKGKERLILEPISQSS